jgi:hypothetical protein
MSHSLAGTWEEAQNAVDATPVVYTIALKGSSIVVSGVDESDGTELRISGVSWDGRQLRFKSLYPPTNHRASHVFRLTAKNRAIHTTTYTDDEGTWGGREQWRKRILPKVIPPHSRVRLIRADKHTPSWRKDVGREFKVGYYSHKDGLDCIWLVNESGKYEQTTDREFLLKYFRIERLSNETNFYGVRKKTARQIEESYVRPRKVLVNAETRQGPLADPIVR